MTKSRLDSRTLDYLFTLVQAATGADDWRAGLDKFLLALRAEFVFDNVAVYMLDPATQILEVVHARAVGRGKSAEADAAWGEEIANRVLASGKFLLHHPTRTPPTNDRLAHASFLGIPVYEGPRLEGVIVFVRFGGPQFAEDQVVLARLAGSWISSLLMQKIRLDIQQHLDALRQKLQFQDDFVATMSHELRTPLGFIKGYSTTLLRSDTTWDPETRKEFLTIIDEETDRLSDLIENILQSAKLQNRSMQLQYQLLRLEALIRDVVIRIRTRNNNLEVEMHFDVLPPIQGDTVRLTQVFENLFSNTLKYAPGAKVKIVVKNERNSLLVSFSDNGPGIPDAYLPYIFERFYRVPGGSSVTGSGLGLYICNQIITAHHGKIWVESKVGQGTTFHLRLPVEPAL